MPLRKCNAAYAGASANPGSAHHSAAGRERHSDWMERHVSRARHADASSAKPTTRASKSPGRPSIDPEGALWCSGNRAHAWHAAAPPRHAQI